MRYIVSVSGGLTSYEALKRTLARYGHEATIAVFADTRIEDPDLYRFLDDIERHLTIPIVRLADGRTVFDVWHDSRALTLRGMNGGIAPCSKHLKRHVIDNWLKTVEGPYTIVLGMDWTEQHRMDVARERYQPVPVWFPLAEPPYLDKCAISEQLERDNIAVPGLYLDGFVHNNCGGGCVKAGQSHFALLWQKRPETFALWEREEQRLREYLEKDISILNDRRGGGPRRPLPLSQFRSMLERGERVPKDEWGACGCFTSSMQLELPYAESAE